MLNRMILEPVDLLNLMEKILCRVMNNILHNIPIVNSVTRFIGLSYHDSIMPKCRPGFAPSHEPHHCTPARPRA